MGGLHPEGGDCTYHRVEDVYDVEVIILVVSSIKLFDLAVC